MAAGRLPDKGRGINAAKRFMPRKLDGWREAVPFHLLSAANDDFGRLRKQRREWGGRGPDSFPIHSAGIAPVCQGAVWNQSARGFLASDARSR